MLEEVTPPLGPGVWQLGLENGEGKKGNSICKGSEARRAGLLEESPACPRNSQGAEASGQSCGATEDSALRLREAPEDLKEGASAGGRGQVRG